MAYLDLVSGLHDAEVISVRICRANKTVSLDLKCDNESVDRLTFSGVVGFRAVDFIQQNVVLRIIFLSEHNFSNHEALKWMVWMNSLSDNSCFLSEDEAQAYASSIKCGDLCIFAVEPSWGAEIAIAFREMSRTKVP